MARATVLPLQKGAKTAISTQLDLQDPDTRTQVMQALGIEEPKPQLSIFDRITGVLDALRFTDDIRKAQKEGNILAGVGDFLADIPKAIGGAITGTDYRDETDKEGGAEILEGMGAQGLAKGVGGFLLDVLGDPTTYVTLGTGSGAKILTKEGAKTLTKSGTKVFNKFTREGIEQLSKSSADEMAEFLTREGIEAAGKTTRQIAEEIATKKVMDFSKKGVKVLADLGLDETDKIAQQVLKEGIIDNGGFKFAGKKLFDLTPETEKMLNLYFNPIKGVDQNLRSVPGIGAQYGKGMDAIGRGASGLIQGATNTVRNLFDRKYNMTGGNAKFNPLYDFMQQSEDYLKGKSQEVVEQFTGEYKQILDAFETPEILPYILEDTPIDKIKELPDNLKESLASALRQLKTEEDAFKAVERVLKPKNIDEMDDIAEEMKPLAKIAQKTSNFAEFKERVDRLVKRGELTIPDNLMSNGGFNMAKFRAVIASDGVDKWISENADAMSEFREILTRRDSMVEGKDRFYQEATKAWKDKWQKEYEKAIPKNAEDYALKQWEKVNKFRDGHRAPEFDPRTIAERMDSGGNFNLVEVVQGNHNQPDDYFDKIVGPRYYSYDDVAGRESLTAIDDIKRAYKSGNLDGKTITAYRAVPRDVDISDLQDGDWISLSKQYAIDHGEARFGEGEYKIIAKEVEPKHVWWDGNDINEWGYDTDKTYRKFIEDFNSGNAKFRTKTKDLPTSVMREFADFIDYTQGNWKPKDPNVYEATIRELASEYDIGAEMSNKRLANKFSSLLDAQEYGKKITSKGGRLNAQTILDISMYRTPKELKETISRSLNDNEISEIINLNKKIFGDEKVKVVEKIITPSGIEALGKYEQSWIDIISKQADAKETYYHEAVHKAIDMFIGKDEKDRLLNYAKKKFNVKNLLDAEEKLAEDFIKYAQGGKSTPTKGIKKIFDSIVNFIRNITGSKDEVRALYDDILSGKFATPKAPEVTEDLYKSLKQTISSGDPLTTQLAEIGKFKSIIDQKGVKRKVFENALSDTQVQFLNSKGIYTAQDLVERSKTKSFYKAGSEAVQVASKRTAPRLTRIQAGKEPIIRTLEEEIRALQTDPRYIDLKNQFKALLTDANYSGDSVEALAEKLGGDELYNEVLEYKRMRGQIEELNARKQEKITELVNKSIVTTSEKTTAFKPTLSEFDQLARGLGVKQDKLKSIIKKANQTIALTTEKVNKKASAEKLLSKVYDIKDPVQKEIITRNIERIANNTDVMLEVGAISGTSTARYLGRDYLVTPSGKNLEESKGIMSLFGKPGLKNKLDPRSATSQKQRVYDYLTDVIKAGGKTKLTETSGKEFVANLAEQLARDEMKAVSAKEYKRLADAIIGNKITDPAGNPLYKNIDNIIKELSDEGVELSDKMRKAVNTFKKTGNVPEQLKEFLKNRGYTQLTQKGGGVIPIFNKVFFDAETNEILTKMHQQFFGDEQFNEFVKMYDKVHNAIKASQTAWFPAFHVRNMFSNVFTNFIEGVKNPQVYKDAQLIQKYNNVLEKIPLADVKKSEKLQNLLKEIGDKVIKLGDTGSYKISELHQLARYNGVITGGIYGDLSENLLKKGELGIRSINPVSENFVLSQAGRKIGSSIEDNARIGLFIDRLAKGDDIRSAALKVKEVLFDYQDLTDFEKQIMKRFVPFYTWTKKNAVLQMKRIVKQPGVYTAYLKGFNEIRDSFSNMSEEDKKKLPDWVKQGIGITFGNGGSNVSVIKQFGLPQEAFENFLETNPLNQLGVLPKAVVEIGTGQNIFKGKAILDDTDGKSFRNFPKFIKDRMGYREEERTTKDGKKYKVYYVDAWAKYYINLLLGRTTSEFSKVSTLGAEGDAPADLLNLFTGIKKYDFNLTEEEEKRNREKSLELYDELIKRGMAREFTNRYIPKDQKESILNQIGN